MDNLSQIFSQTADGAFVVDQNQRILYWNQAAQDLLGYTTDEVVGRPCYEIMQGCDNEGRLICRHNCSIAARALAGRNVPCHDVVTQTKSCQTCWINVSILTISADHNGSSQIVHLFRDATTIKQNEQLINQMVNTLEGWRKEPVAAAPLGSIPSSTDNLTHREREVLVLLAQGLSTADIAASLSISAATVRNHVQRILHKLGVHSRLEAVAYAFDHGLVARGSERKRSES